MAKPRLIVHVAAKTDVNKIGVYIAEHNLDAGLRFFDAAKHAFQLLAENPRLGPLHQSRNKRLRDIRSWPITGFENYLIFYRTLDPRGVEVLRVLRGTRNVDRILAKS